MPVRRPQAPLETSNEKVPCPASGGWLRFAPMSSWIRDANAGSLRILSWYTPTLISRSSSPAVRRARSRHERAAASTASSAPGAIERSCATAVAVASMIVPMALHQLIDLEDHGSHLEARGDRQEHDSVLLGEAALAEVLPQRDEMRRRRGVTELVDGHHHVLRRATHALGELLGALLDRPCGGLMGDEVVDLVE